MQKIAMGGVDLQDPKACGKGTLSCLSESVDSALDFRNAELLGSLIGCGKGNGTGGVNRRPATLFGAKRSAALPWNLGACFAAGMCELHSRDGALGADELNDSGEEVDMSILPDSEIRPGDAALRSHRSGFGEHETSAGYGTSAEVDQVPVVGEAVFTGILAHG